MTALPDRPILVRPVRPAERGIVRAMHRQALMALARDHYSPGQLRAMLATIDTAEPGQIAAGRLLAAWQGPRPLATAGWMWERPAYEDAATAAEPAGVATIRSVFVDPAWAGRGLGRRMVAAAESGAALEGAVAYALVATLNAAPVYARLGYQPGAPVELVLRGGLRFPGLRMSKPAPAELAA